MADIQPFHSAPIHIGPGILFVAPIGTTVPTGIHGGPDATKTPGVNGTQFGAGWIPVGYTEDGSEFSYAITTADVEVAESLVPVRIMTTKVEMSVKFACAEMTADNIQMAINGGVAPITPPTLPVIHVSVAPPAAGLEQRIMLAWDREDGLERMVWFRVIQAGNLSVMRKKAPAMSALPVEFKVEMPSTGVPVDWRIAASLIAAA